MPDPFEVKQRTPWTPWDTGRDVSNFFKTRSAKKQGMTIQRPSGETVFQAPKQLGTPFGAPIPTSWDELKFVDKRYGDVIQALAQSGSPDLYQIALKSRTNEPLSPDEIVLINEAWKIMMEERYRETPEGFDALSPEKRAFEISQSGKAEQERLNVASENRYVGQRQAAEGKRLDDEQKQRQKQAVEIEKKKMALKGPGEWMKYMTELGEEPSWLGYWFARRS